MLTILRIKCFFVERLDWRNATSHHPGFGAALKRLFGEKCVTCTRGNRQTGRRHCHLSLRHPQGQLHRATHTALRPAECKCVAKFTAPETPPTRVVVCHHALHKAAPASRVHCASASAHSSRLVFCSLAAHVFPYICYCLRGEQRPVMRMTPPPVSQENFTRSNSMNWYFAATYSNSKGNIFEIAVHKARTASIPCPLRFVCGQEETLRRGMSQSQSMA